MKPKYIIGIVLAVAFTVVAVLSFNTSKIEYADFSAAESHPGKTYQVIGTWVKDKPSEYNSEANIFTFAMKDEKGVVKVVNFKGSKPNNFEAAESIVAKGKYDNTTFVATEVLTKCPSKYEAKSSQ